MERVCIIALDTHCAFTEVGVLTPGGRARERGRCATTIPALAEEIDRVPRPRAVVLEEGPLADWIARGRSEHADDVAVCDPRRATCGERPAGPFSPARPAAGGPTSTVRERCPQGKYAP